MNLTLAEAVRKDAVFIITLKQGCRTASQKATIDAIVDRKAHDLTNEFTVLPTGCTHYGSYVRVPVEDAPAMLALAQLFTRNVRTVFPNIEQWRLDTIKVIVDKRD